MKQIKILFIITQGEMGGAQRYVFDLATNLDKNKYEIIVAVGNGEDMLSKTLGDKGYRVLKIQNLVRNIHPLKDLAAILEIKNIIKKINPDIIHLNSSKAGVIGSLAARLAGKKNVIFTAHGFAFLEPNSFLVKQIYFRAEKIASYFRKKIITVSEYDKTSAIADKLSKPKKFITIHNGVVPISPPREGEIKRGLISSNPSSQPSRKATADTARGGVKIVIGTIAHDYPTKDLGTLRNAFEIVHREFPQTELKIISGVPQASQFLSELNIYACSSIKEGFPYTILEAMRAGLPIVSTDVGGIPEAITDGKEGLLVPPKNPEAMAQAIKKLLTNPALAAQLSQNAKQKSLQFTLARMIRETEAVYQSIINYR